MDTIRDGAFGLTNTNRLVRFYNGCTGLKTGSTEKAGFCVSATAKRGEMSLICVIMGAESRDIRNAEATSLLDWGFANYELYRVPAQELSPISIIGGKASECKTISSEFTCVLPKNRVSSVEQVVELPKKLSAPISRGDVVGKIIFKVGGTSIGECEIRAIENIPKISFFDIFCRALANFLLI